MLKNNDTYSKALYNALMEPRLGDVPSVIEPPLEIPPQLAEDFARITHLVEVARDKISDFEASTNPERWDLLQNMGFMPLYMHLVSLYVKTQGVVDAEPTKANQRLLVELKRVLDAHVKSLALGKPQ